MPTSIASTLLDRPYIPRREDKERTLREVIAAILELIPDDIPRESMPSWAERKRIIPAGLSPVSGPYDYAVTPYLREIAEALSETSPIQYVAVMKGTRGGFSVGLVENWIGYTIDVSPGPMGYITADDDVLKTTMEIRLNPMIELSGLSKKVFSQSKVNKKESRLSGSTQRKKEFAGGYLLGLGPNSGAKLRNFSFQKIAFDEVEAYPIEIKGEGDPLSIAEKRANEWGDSKKILYISTPAILQNSRIHTKYLEGDQRKYFVPCKHCGTLQTVEWKNIHYEKDAEGRLVFDKDAEGKPVKGTGHVWYECKECGGHWRNEDKGFFLAEKGHGGFAEWRATATASRPLSVSYFWSALLSPLGMYHWEDAVLEWIAAQGDINKLRTFINTVLGEPFEERGQAPDYQRVMLRREDYAAEALIVKEDGPPEWLEARLPPEALVLTAGVDVQHDRIEVEEVAWGKNMESWSAGYHVFEGDTSDLDSPAWAALTDVIERVRPGLPLSLTLIDSGDGGMTPTVYSYCDRFESRVLPLKGGYRQGVKIFGLGDIYGHHRKRVDLNEGYLKSEFYRLVKNGPADRPGEGQPLPEGYCHFPQEYDRRHFEKLFAEDLIIELDRLGHPKYNWKRRGRNEALDCRAYALGALYVIASLVTADTDDKTGTVDWPLFWEYAARLNRRAA